MSTKIEIQRALAGFQTREVTLGATTVLVREMSLAERDQFFDEIIGDDELIEPVEKPQTSEQRQEAKRQRLENKQVVRERNKRIHAFFAQFIVDVNGEPVFSEPERDGVFQFESHFNAVRKAVYELSDIATSEDDETQAAENFGETRSNG